MYFEEKPPFFIGGQYYWCSSENFLTSEIPCGFVLLPFYLMLSGILSNYARVIQFLELPPPPQQDGGGGTFQDKNDDFARIVSVTAHFCQFSPGWNQSGILSPD